MMISVGDRAEGIVGKQAGNQHFLLFPQRFLWAIFLGVIKSTVNTEFHGKG